MPTVSRRPDPSAIADYDTAMVFNAVRTLLGGGPEGEGLEHIGGVPINYPDQTLRSMLPDLGCAVGHATTCEVTTNDTGVDARVCPDFG